LSHTGVKYVLSVIKFCLLNTANYTVVCRKSTVSSSVYTLSRCRIRSCQLR